MQESDRGHLAYLGLVGIADCFGIGVEMGMGNLVEMSVRDLEYLKSDPGPSC